MKTPKLLLIFTVLYIAFISLFALDSLSESIAGFLVHLIPSVLLVITLLISVKDPKLGGLIFVVLSICATIFFSTTMNAVTFLLISVPILAIGVAFVSTKTSGIKELLFPVVTTIFVTSVFLFVLSIVSIGYDVNSTCKEAQRFHEGDCVTALTEYLEIETYPLASRKRVVWALGQFGDKRALPVLTYYLTGEECNHDTSLCQYELQKAIKWCSTDENMLSPVWQKLFL